MLNNKTCGVAMRVGSRALTFVKFTQLFNRCFYFKAFVYLLSCSLSSPVVGGPAVSSLVSILSGYEIVIVTKEATRMLMREEITGTYPRRRAPQLLIKFAFLIFQTIGFFFKV